MSHFDTELVRYIIYRATKGASLIPIFTKRRLIDAEKAIELIALAGYSLSNSDTVDLVVRFCIEKGIYDLIIVNEVLNYFGVKSIGMLKDKR